VSTTPEILWTPDPAQARTSALAQFARTVRHTYHLDFDELDYARIHAWSVEDTDGFWSTLAEFCDVVFHEQPTSTLNSPNMADTTWFPGATLNYAEHSLRPGPGRMDQDTAAIFIREDGYEESLTHAELRDRVARTIAGFRRLGVRSGDRVAALVPNTIEALVAFLAAASIGAIWTSCSPDFGIRAIADRFTQIEPTLLVAVDSYCYGGRRFDTATKLSSLQSQLPTLAATVLITDKDGPVPPSTVRWRDVLTEAAALTFEPVPFDHPLWILYSSGTTGLPKAIVHGHGGILLDHMKALRLHLDIGPSDRFFWFTTTGWMMWNYLIAGLLVGATIVMYDGNPGFPDLGVQWRVVQRHRVTYFGLSAAFVHASLKQELAPGTQYDLSSLRGIGCTGSPLSQAGFRWLHEAATPALPINSMSGGTDVCAAFIGASPTVPVWLGEISSAWLGAAVCAYDEDGHELVDEIGELVLTKPMPSMPVAFWNDPGRTRLHAAYFEDYPGVWRHGDWVRQTPRGSFVISGRSDSTVNRGGIRMGTADFYSVVEENDDTTDSLVIDMSGTDSGGLICFISLRPRAVFSQVEVALRDALRRELSPRHVPDLFVQVEAVPRTVTGKKIEVPIKKILAGADPDQALSREALAAPELLDPFLAAARSALHEHTGRGRDG
jgi:acetoacetyl-CoA synthetase